MGSRELYIGDGISFIVFTSSLELRLNTFTNPATYKALGYYLYV
jgi:hypothetical protein